MTHLKHQTKNVSMSLFSVLGDMSPTLAVNARSNKNLFLELSSYFLESRKDGGNAFNFNPK